MKPLTIGKVAQRAGIGVGTVRFYEREGLIAEPPRSDSSGYRHYPEEAVTRLSFVKKAKFLGFSLKEIRELLALKARPFGNCEDVCARATKKIEDIDQKIVVLQSMRKALTGLVDECSRSGPRSECPILDSLDTVEIV